MNAEQMRSALTAFADLIGREGASRRANELNRLAKLFEGVGTPKVATIVTTIEGNWKIENREPRHPPELEKVLSDIQQAFARSGAKAQTNAFMAVLRLFSGADDQPVDAFVAEAIAARVKKPRPRGSARTKTPFTTEEARKLASQLTSAAEDRKRFDTLLDQFKNRFKIAELQAIAGFYIGYETNKTKKGDILKAIRNWHREGELNRDRRASQAKAGL